VVNKLALKEETLLIKRSISTGLTPLRALTLFVKLKIEGKTWALVYAITVAREVLAVFPTWLIRNKSLGTRPVILSNSCICFCIC
jgi:hypothetical protein